MRKIFKVCNISDVGQRNALSGIFYKNIKKDQSSPRDFFNTNG